jgi:hypothetical protein
MILVRTKVWGLWALLLLVAGVARAQPNEPAPAVDAAPAEPAASLEVLSNWAHSPEAQRNRVEAGALSPEVQSELLSVLSRGVSGCDCLARRVRWAWALPLPHDRAHPAVVVAFVDPPRDQSSVLWHLRFAFLRFREGRYVVTSALALRRPAMAMDAALTVRLLPRRDVDDDKQLDIALKFQERWQGQGYCGIATFASAAEQLTLEEEECASEESLPEVDPVAYP